MIAFVWLRRLLPRNFEADPSGRQIQRGDQPLTLAFSQRIEQVDDGCNALGDMAADGMVQRLVAVLEQDRRAQQLSDNQPTRQKQQQATEQRSRQPAHQRSRLTWAASR